MCARAVDKSFNNGDHQSSWPDNGQTGNDVTASCVTSPGEFPVASRRRRRGIPPAWRYSLPSALTNSITTSVAVRQPVDNTLPTSVSISGSDNELVSGVGRRRPLCKYVTTGSRNVTESAPRIKPTCLRYSYWLTLDDRRYASKYSTLTSDKFENQLRRRFRPRSCEIINDGRNPASCRVDSPRNGELVTNNDDDGCVVRRHVTCSHVTESSASGQIISSSTSALDVKTDCGGRLTYAANCNCATVRLNPDDDREGPVNSFSDVSVDRSRDEEVKGQRRLSLSKIGDSGLGASIHSEQTSPEETSALDHGYRHHHHHQQQQQQQLHQRLSDNNDDDETRDVGECQCQSQREGHCERYVKGHIDEENNDDDRTQLTRHKRE